jgi:hypothetical protein
VTQPRKISLATALAFAIAVVPAPVPAAQALAARTAIQTFRSPTGNTGCRYDPRDRELPILRCDVAGGVPNDPNGPKSDCPGRQLGFRLDSYGPQSVCEGPSVLHSGPVLAYGTTWTAGVFTCTSRATGLTCVNKHGLGFFLALGEGHVISPFGTHSYAATPQAIAVDDLGSMQLADAPEDLTPVRVERVNVAGPYAIVVAEQYHRPHTVLVERFPFGWQALFDDVPGCALGARGIGATDQQTLLAGLTGIIPKDPAGSCGRVSRVFRDIGPATDVAAIRKLALFTYVPYAGVDGDFGYADEYGEVGSCQYFHRTNGTWTSVTSCHGEISLNALKPYGFTQHILCEIRPDLPDKECPDRRRSSSAWLRKMIPARRDEFPRFLGLHQAHSRFARQAPDPKQRLPKPLRKRPRQMCERARLHRHQ